MVYLLCLHASDQLTADGWSSVRSMNCSQLSSMHHLPYIVYLMTANRVTQLLSLVYICSRMLVRVHLLLI